MTEVQTTLGVRIDDSGSLTTIGELDQAIDRLGHSSQRMGQSVQQSSIDLKAAERAFDNMYGSTTRVTDSTRRMTLMHMEALRMNEAMSVSTGKSTAELGRLSAMTGAGRQGLGRLSTAFAGLATRMAGVSPILGTLAATLGGFAVGGVVTAGVLAGVALLIRIWQDFNKEAREAQKEVDELRDRLLDQAAKRYADTVQGATDDVRKMEGEVARLNDQLERGVSLWDKFKTFWVGGGLAAVRGLGAGRTETRDQTQAAANEARARRQEIVDREREEADDRARRAAKEAEEERKRARALVFANEERQRLAAQELETIGVTGPLLEQMRSRHQLINDILRVRETLRGAELEAAERALALEEGIRTSAIAVNQALRERNAARDANAEILDETVERASKEREYQQEMQAIWRQGIGRIVTDGTKSFQDFFENVLRLFSDLMKNMEESGKNSGFMYGALKMGGAAIGGGLAGYEMGSRSANRGMGATMGAASGAATAFAMSGGNPIAAAAGALTGFIGGLLGSGKAAREAAREMRKLQDQLDATMKALRAQVSGDTLGQTIAQIEAQTDALKRQASEAYKGRKNETERFRVQREAEDLGAKLIAQAREEHALRQQQFTEDLRVRAAVAAGRSAEAEQLAFALGQERELAEARRNGATAAQLATLQEIQAAEAEQRRANIAREYQRSLEDLNLRLAIANGLTDDQASELAAATAAQREYEDAVRAGRDEAYLSTLQQVHLAEAYKRSSDRIKATISELAQTIAGLETFRNSLLLGATTNLGPEAQLREARRQYEEVLGAAKLGDQSAAGRLPGSAQTFLDLSRQVNATGGMFTADFNRVLSDTQGLIDLFSVQKTIAEQQLEELRRIHEAATRITDNTGHIAERIIEPLDTSPSIPWDDMLVELRAGVAVSGGGSSQIINRLDMLTSALEENTRETRRGFEQWQVAAT